MLRNQPQKVEIYATVDDRGNYKIVTKDDPDAFYWLVADINLDINPATKTPYDIVQFKTDDVQTIKYFVNLKNAEFQTYFGPRKVIFKQDPNADPWKLVYHVKLAMGPAALANLDPKIREKIKKSTQNLSGDIFSIEQLYIDLNQATFVSEQTIKDMPDVVTANLDGIIRLYLKTLKETGDLILGVNVKFTGKDPAKRPTFMPSSVDFGITPYSTTQPNRNLDTLNYLVMTDGRSPPAYPPKAFPFKFVDSPNYQGAIAVKSNLIVPFVIEKLRPILKTISPQLKVQAYDGGSSISLNKCTASPVWKSKQGTLGYYSWISKDSAEAHGPWYSYWSKSVDGEFTSNVTVSIPSHARNLIHFDGMITLEFESSTSYSGQRTPPHPIVLPKTYFPWSLDISMQVDLDDTSKLKFSIANQNFNTKPYLDDQRSGWEKFLDALSGTFRECVNDVTNARVSIQNTINQTAPDLTKALQESHDVSIFRLIASLIGIVLTILRSVRVSRRQDVCL